MTIVSLLLATLPAAAGVFPYPVEQRTLDNGLTIYVVDMPSPGVVSWTVWMSVGSRDEIEPGRTGFAHFFEHLMFYGTERLGREARERWMLRAGAEDNAWTWYDETVYTVDLSPESLHELVGIEADRFQRLALTADQVRKESGAVYGEYRKGQSDPEWRVAELLYRTAFQVHTYHHDTIGFEEDIAKMPDAYDHAMSFFDRLYRPENAAILVVGDVDAAAVLDDVATQFAPWEKAKAPRPEIPAEPPQTETRTASLTWPAPTAPKLALGWKIPGERPDDPAVAALALLSDYLLSETGPLHRRLVIEEGLAYDVHGGRDRFYDPCLFVVGVTLKDQKDLDRVRAIVDEEIKRVQSGIEPSVVAATRSHSRYGFLSSLDDPQTVASALGWSLRRGGTSDALNRFYAHYDAVTPALAAQAAKEYLVPQHLTVVTLLPPAEGQ